MDQLPKLHLSAYGGLRSRLERFCDRLLVQDSPSGSLIDLPTLGAEWQSLQSYFQTHVLTLTAEGLAADQAHHWQSLQTEIHRTMRLLNTDILFLRASRQVSTTQQRMTLICDQLAQLNRYCQLLTDADPESGLTENDY